LKEKKNQVSFGSPGFGRAVVTAGLLLNPDRSSHRVDTSGRAGFNNSGLNCTTMYSIMASKLEPFLLFFVSFCPLFKPLHTYPQLHNLFKYQKQASKSRLSTFFSSKPLLFCFLGDHDQVVALVGGPSHDPTPLIPSLYDSPYLPSSWKLCPVYDFPFPPVQTTLLVWSG